MIDWVKGLRIWRLNQEPKRSCVFMLPGFGGGLEFLIPTAESLAPSLPGHWGIVIADTPGFGASENSASTTQEAVEKLVEVIMAMDCDDLVFVGQSSGSMLELLVSERLCDSTVNVLGACFVGGSQTDLSSLIGSLPLVNPLSRNGILAWWTLLAATGRMPAPVRSLALRLSLIRRLVMWPYLHDPSAVSEQELAPLLRNSGSWHAWRFARSTKAYNLIDIVRTNDKPLWLIRGEYDRYVSGKDVEWFKENTIVLESVEIANAGHWCGLESQQVTDAAINEAIRSLIGQ